jgi:2-polyprenyl-6-methoxyphenol hydroxylase-like FAD-dependent oxidoreductase
MRGKDRWRVIGILPEELRGRDDLVFAEVEPSIRDEAGANLSFKACAWFSTYRIYHRAAEKFQDRRIFLMGDAAHIHSPAGAQGMNTGLQDAYNLAWKLALVAQGRADERLLATYAAERMPVAQRLLKSTDRLFTLLVSKGLFGMLLRTRLAPRFLAFGMNACDDWRSTLSRRSAFTIAVARYRRRWWVWPSARHRLATGFRGCNWGFSRTGKSRTCTAGSMTCTSTSS